jgi:hypothetical protein
MSLRVLPVACLVVTISSAAFVTVTAILLSLPFLW